MDRETVTIRKDAGTVVAGIPERLMVGNRQELKQKVLDELERGEKKFLIDFAQTGYIDSSGLGLLVSLSKKIRNTGGELRLANLNADLRTLFELTKLDTLFRLRDDDGGSAGTGVPARVHPPPRGPGAAEELS